MLFEHVCEARLIKHAMYFVAKQWCNSHVTLESMHQPFYLSCFTAPNGKATVSFGLQCLPQNASILEGHEESWRCTEQLHLVGDRQVGQSKQEAQDGL